MNKQVQSLQGQSAIISGGSTELAAEIALALASQGVKVCLCGRSADLLELAAANIRSTGGRCLTIVSGLETLPDAESVVGKAVSAFGRLDILVFVSPFWVGGAIHTLNVKTWDLVVNANLREPFLMARAALPLLRAQKHGEIMAVGSDSALGVYPEDGAYGVSMHALKELIQLIGVENADSGIRTHFLSPGLAVTPNEAVEKNLTTADVAEWVVWLLTRPTHLRGNGPVLL